jgi:transcriptional regulator
MYLPAHFTETDLAALDALAVGYPFATLITVADGAPFVSHVPVLYRREGQDIELRGHWARPNPQWRHGGEATVILHGPDAYVSPAWYPDKAAEARVPTWNYAVAHLAGTLEILQDEADLASIVSGLAARFEAGVQAADPAHVAWQFDLANDAERVQLRGIVGFRLRPARVELKFKLNQNHPAPNVAAVAAQLEHGNDDQRAVAALMRERLESRTLTPAPLPMGEGNSTENDA